MGKPVKIYKDAAAGLIFFEGSPVDPAPVNAVVAEAHPTITGRVVIYRTDSLVEGAHKVLFKKKRFQFLLDEEGNAYADQATCVAALNDIFLQASATQEIENSSLHKLRHNCGRRLHGL